MAALCGISAMPRSSKAAARSGSDSKYGRASSSHSEPAGSNVGGAPTASTSVSGSVATASRCVPGRTSTSVPGRASISSPSSVKRAAPVMTT